VLGQPGSGEHASRHLDAGTEQTRDYTYGARDHYTGDVDPDAHSARDHDSVHPGDDPDDHAFDFDPDPDHIGHHVRFSDADGGRLG